MNTCATCKHTTTKPGHAGMYSRGFRNCAHLPDWQFISGISACRFNPSKWEKRQ